MHVRIRELANLFPRGSALIDVGSDHGYLGLQLFREDKAVSVVNIDLSRSALTRSKKIYKQEGYYKRSVFLLTDGFGGIVNWPKNSVAVIAGMGTYQILKILNRMPEDLNHLLLLSHTDYYQIRKWAFANAFQIKNEKYVEDGDFVYLILDLVRNEKREHGTTRDYIFGRREFWKDTQRRLFEKYWRKNMRRINKIPPEFRDELEQETLKALSEEGIE